MRWRSPSKPSCRFAKLVSDRHRVRRSLIGPTAFIVPRTPEKRTLTDNGVAVIGGRRRRPNCPDTATSLLRLSAVIRQSIFAAHLSPT